MNRGKQRKAGRLWARVALAAAVLVALALPLGAGSAMGSAPGVVPLAAGEQCISGDPTWCLTVGVSPTSSGTVAVDDCVTDGSGLQERCPSGKVNRNPNYPATCPTNSYCSKGGLGIIAGDTVVLTAIPASSGWAFSRWSSSSGDTVCTNAGNPCTFTMPAHGTMTTPVSITANFVQLWQLSVTVSPSVGGTVTDDAGISCPTTCRARYSNGTPVSLTESAAPGYRFTGWRGACTNSTGGCTLTMDSDKDVTANFVRVFKLTIAVSGGGSVSYSPAGDGSGTCPTSCVVQYDPGTSVVLTASNGSDVFTGWGGDCASRATQSNCTLTMDAAKNVTANFGPLFKLTLAVTGNGSVTYSPAGNGTGSCSSSCTVQFVQNTGVTLTAAAGSDPFKTWGGDCASNGTQPSCTLTMDMDKSVTATFEALATPHVRLTVGVTGSGKVTTSGIDCSPQVEVGCQSDYLAGSSLTLVGIPEPGFNFRNWDGACASYGAQPSCTLKMDNNKNVTATFTTKPVIGDLPPCSPGLQVPCETSQLPEPKKSLAVSLSGADGGKVTGGPSGGAHTLASSLDTSTSIACGADSYVCYGDYSTGQSVTLTAKPAKGFRFTGWTGACGKQPSCTLSLSEARKITAAFAPKTKRVSNMSMRAPSFQVRWKESIGSGQLIVTGSIARQAKLIFDLRRPHAGPLVHLTKTVKRAGAFRIALRLPSRLFPKGAKLFPGGKVISIRGEARPYYFPMQVQTVSLHGTPEGVVRRSFASVTRAGRSVPVLPASAKIAWANFRLEQQPAAALPLHVKWFLPNGGKLLGFVRKANRPVVSSFLRSGQPLPRGCWRAELWVGAKVVGQQLVGGKRIKRQAVGIGTKC